MAEAFAVLSIAANIAQFTDYARQLISGGKEIYTSLDGARDEHKALKAIIDDVKSLAHDNSRATANSRSQSSNADEVAFRKLAAECEPLADKLLDILKDLEVPHDARFRGLQTVRQTLRGAAKRRNIQELMRRITDVDVRLRYRAARLLEEKHYASISSAINSLTRESERLNMNTKQRLELLRLDILHTINMPPMEQSYFDDLPSKLRSFIEEGQVLAQQQAILQTLLFEEMKQREESIKDAHKTTLDWMFQTNETKFNRWLGTEKGIYWVRGKAGSGKSTLMKYICNHKKTLKTLEYWADSKQLFTASFFFWNSGFPMQKSQVGLLQSLLYQVLRACPALIKEVCPPKAPGESWKRKELFDALIKVSNQATLPAKFCFFVDGLDEYEGEDEDIIALLRDLASSPCVKICVSSRPWNAFVDAFDDSEWKLVLESLTKDDMRTYVQTQLVQNDAFSRMTLHDPRCQRLVSQIAQKAQGVWLWVYLVVRDLLRDLRGEEEYPLLQRRLDSFPAELEKYFEVILDRIDKIHREETARIFLVAVTAIQPFPVLSLQYLSMEAADPDYAIHMPLSRMSKRKAFQIKKKWTKLLNSRCRDLLEIDDTFICGESFLDGKVAFLHRTVRDFLHNNYYNELLKRAGDKFDARAALCKTIICLAKASFDPMPAPDSTCYDQRRPNFELVDEMLIYARDYERVQARSMTDLVDELDRVNTVMTEGEHGHWTNLRERPRLPLEEDKTCTFLALAIQAGLRLYVNEKLEADKALLTQKRGRPLLDYGCRPKRLSDILYQLEQDNVLDPLTVRILLEHGSDPNQPTGSSLTVWSQFICSCVDRADAPYNGLKIPSQDVKAVWFEVAELLVEYGARVADSTDDLTIFRLTLQNLFPEGKGKRLILRMEEVALHNRPKPSIFWRLLGRT